MRKTSVVIIMAVLAALVFTATVSAGLFGMSYSERPPIYDVTYSIPDQYFVVENQAEISVYSYKNGGSGWIISVPYHTVGDTSMVFTPTCSGHAKIKLKATVGQNGEKDNTVVYDEIRIQTRHPALPRC